MPTPTRSAGSAPSARSAWAGLLIVGRGHLEQALQVYVQHYNAHRPHRALRLQPPDPAARPALIGNEQPARVRRRDLLDGLLHEHRRAAWPHLCTLWARVTRAVRSVIDR